MQDFLICRFRFFDRRWYFVACKCRFLNGKPPEEISGGLHDANVRG
jgi:hypothetical protein